MRKLTLLIQRFLAFGLDVSITGMLAMAALRVIRLLWPEYSYHSLCPPSGLFAVDLVLVVLFRWPVAEPMVISAVYVILSTRLIGGTLGMWAFDLRMLSPESVRPPMWQVGVRHFLSYVSMFVFFLGYLWALVDYRGRTWHDVLSGIEIVDESEASRFLGDPGSANPRHPSRGA